MQTEDQGLGRRRGRALIAFAAIAGVLAGTVAVYVNRSGEGNGTAAAAVDCDGALATARRISPLATGELAAFRVATGPDALADLTFTGVDGNPVHLADFAGRTVLVNLWATWCVPCRAEMPALDQLEADLGGKGFQVVAINLDTKNVERAPAFLNEVGASHIAFYSDPTLGVLNDMKKRGLAIGLPTTLLVDGNGCRIGIIEGPAAWDSADAKALLKAALAG